MSPLLRALFFEVMGLYSAWSIVQDIKAGASTNRGMTIEAKDNPGGFYLIQFVKTCFVCFAIAVLLNTLGLIGDPYIWLKQNLPFLAPR